jgi:hypothetical protein
MARMIQQKRKIPTQKRRKKSWGENVGQKF